MVTSISIHTSAREVTGAKQPVLPANSISIHTSAREVTRQILKTWSDSKISIHTSAREVTAPPGLSICVPIEYTLFLSLYIIAYKRG